MTAQKILLVEDNADDQELIIRSLRRHNIANEIVVANDGVEALDFLWGRREYEGRDVSVTPAVVLLDIMMPRLSGLEVLEKMRGDERTKFIPVVVLTSSDDAGDIFSSYVKGANSFVRKPVEFGEFGEAVKQLGRYWIVLNQPPVK
jgi:CheY-like chemotaxis protein